jgi:dTDP-4-dehydrorhamnose 3,5-epimerase
LIAEKPDTTHLHAERTDLQGVIILEPDVYSDPRGLFYESFHTKKYCAFGIPGPFVQDNFSRSVAGCVRGLHLQLKQPQGKLIRVLRGTIRDMAVDVRRGSPTFGRWVSIDLSAESYQQIYVPAGFAHGFSVLSDGAEVEYKCTTHYDASDEVGIAWNDPELGIDWGVESPLLSERDAAHGTLAELVKQRTKDLPLYKEVFRR